MIKLIVTDVDGTLVEDGFTNVDPRLFDDPETEGKRNPVCSCQRKTLGQCGTYL